MHCSTELLRGTGRSILEAGALPLPADVGIEGAELAWLRGGAVFEAFFDVFNINRVLLLSSLDLKIDI